MRTIRYHHDGAVRDGTLHGEVVHEFDAPAISGGRPTGATVSFDAVRLLTPVTPSTIICVGRNYQAHIEEMGYETPRSPSLFFKPLTTLVDPDCDVVLPPEQVSSHVEHEVELAIVIARRARALTLDNALDAVFGYTVANDVSARDLQRADGNNVRGKSVDTFCPVGPWIDTDLAIAEGVQVSCDVNGTRRQEGSTNDLVFDIPTLLAFITSVMTLQPGDLVLTGSPGGSDRLTEGDRVELTVEGLGTLRHGVRAG